MVKVIFCVSIQDGDYDFRFVNDCNWAGHVGGGC